MELGNGSITLTISEGEPLAVDVRGRELTIGADPVTLALDPVPQPEPTVFPSGHPTASIPVVRANS